MSQLQLSLLGTPVVKHGERTLTFSTRKALALLVYLAVEGGTHPRKTLSEAFWPELDAEHGRAALRATLLELRKLLERCHGPGERAHLLVERDTLGFDQGSPLMLDLRLVESASKQVGQGVEALEGQMHGELLAQLEQATRLARGPFLASFTLRDSQFFDDWTRQHREYWHLRVHQLFDALSMLYERAGDREHAIDTVSRWLSFDPLNEEGYRRLMRLRFSQGDRAGALRAYANGRAVLADELQVEPEPETVALAKRIRHTAPLRPAQPRRLLQPHSSSLSPGQPPANVLDGPFLGREAEFGTLIECYQRVHAGQPELVLLQGEAGIGKTRLATEFVGWAQAQGADVLTGRALQTGRQLPYQPLIDVLRLRLEQEHAPDDLLSDVWLAELSRLLPELRDRYPDLPVPSTDEAFGHNRLFEATARLVQIWAARRPLVLLLDDMQWADTATLDLVLYLVRSLAQQPAPVQLLLNLRTGADSFTDVQSTWLMALKRTRIPLTALVLAAFTKEETQRFVQALAWVEQPFEVGNNGSTEVCPENSASIQPCNDYLSPRQGPACLRPVSRAVRRREASIFRDALVPFANWLYFQTQGQPLYLVETLQGLRAREIIVPSLQDNGSWGLKLRTGLLVQTPVGELIPSSLRELIRSQLGRLTPSAWALLVSGAVLGQGLTFERLIQVAQLDEQEGLRALEELLRNGLLCEGTLVEESQAFDGYAFPREMIRKVVYQEAGVTRQRLVQRRVSAVMQAEAEDDPGEETHLPHPAPGNGYASAETRNGWGRRVAARVVSRGMRGTHRAVAMDSSGVTRRHGGTYEKTPLAAWERSAAGQAAPAFPRSPPGSLARAFLRTSKRFPSRCARIMQGESKNVSRTERDTTLGVFAPFASHPFLPVGARD
jgi:DNA-binding SARP family transcriptional activator